MVTPSLLCALCLYSAFQPIVSNMNGNSPYPTRPSVTPDQWGHLVQDHYSGGMSAWSRDEGMYFVKVIFENFGKDDEMTTESLKRLLMAIGIGGQTKGRCGQIGHHQSEGVISDHHNHAEHDSEEHGAGKSDHHDHAEHGAGKSDHHDHAEHGAGKSDHHDHAEHGAGKSDHHDHAEHGAGKSDHHDHAEHHLKELGAGKSDHHDHAEHHLKELGAAKSDHHDHAEHGAGKSDHHDHAEHNSEEQESMNSANNDHAHNHQDAAASQSTTEVERDTNSEHDHNDQDSAHQHQQISKSPSGLDANGQQRDSTRRQRSTSHQHKHHTRCLDVQELLQIYQYQGKDSITTEQFLYLCPAVVYQINNDKCMRPDHTGHSHVEDDTSETVGFGFSSVSVWGYSTLAVIIISLVGLLGVAVIPIMQKVFYNHLLQFLVALAVGALTGDALLHLLPHAIIGKHHHHSDEEHGSHGDLETHHSVVLKGLCGLGGFFFFFLAERLVTIFTSFKRRRTQRKRLASSHVDTYPGKDSQRYIAQKLAAYSELNREPCVQRIMGDETPTTLWVGSHDKVIHIDNDLCSSKVIKHPHPNTETDEEEGMLSHHSHGGHMHSHGTEILTNSVASVAWMVILGDGIHNFCDGLAIGAAFADNITGGFSTTIAVFCHELPHEIGDFALLLRAGMSVKQAVVYNVLSSVLCFMGMLIGVAIGNIDSVSQWVFASVAGMFIYIAMVDMLPEMTSLDMKEENCHLGHLFLHSLGMMLGAGIMLVIALYEEHLLTVLET